jgi:hypothetical protein
MTPTSEEPDTALETDDPVAVAHAITKLSEASFSRIWDNDEDTAYDKL